MNGLAILIPVALGLGLLGLAAFFWAASHYTGSIAVYIAIHFALVTFAVGTTPIGLTRPVNAVFDRIFAGRPRKRRQGE